MAGTSPRIGAPRVKLDANTRTGARPKHEPRWNSGRSDRRYRGKARVFRMHYLQCGAIDDFLCTSECSPEWRMRFRRVVGRHRGVAPSAEWEYMESPELYVKQETVSTTFNSECQPDEPGDRICAFGREMGQDG